MTEGGGDAAMGMPVLSAGLLLCFIALPTSAQGQSTAGFISIDCGHAGEGYRHRTGILYSSDMNYIDTGVNRNVSEPNDLGQRFGDLRSFPNGTRNCYTLPVRRGGKYLIKAGFVYGNYDGLRQPPKFDMYLGVNFWRKVKDNNTFVEIITVAPVSYMQVCLVNSGTGTPFISALELRPLADSMYMLANATQSLVLRHRRRNYGGQPQVQIRYPDDPYDRVWCTPDDQTALMILSSDGNAQVNPDQGGEFQHVPPVVMGTAVTPASLSGRLNITVSDDLTKKIYVMMYFAELQKLRPNESRVFDVYKEDSAGQTLVFQAYMPRYLRTEALYTTKTGSGRPTATFSLAPTGNSTLPPMLNALEVYTLMPTTQLPTDERDASAILSIKQSFRIRKNWEGDPCAPRHFIWEGLGCSFDAFNNPRIISLNLSSNNLTGSIPSSLTNLKDLRSLDLSHNNLMREIPGFLSELPVLHVLNLSNNQLSGKVPQALVQKFQDGSLLLRSVGSCEVVKRKKTLVPVIIAASSAFLLILIILLLLLWIYMRRRQSGAPLIRLRDLPRMNANLVVQNLQPEACQFSYSQIIGITKNFERNIGRCGFGTVYHGLLPDGTQVAVKTISKTSPHGVKQFLAEAQALVRVHHKNLVSLLGYCNDVDQLALVYEFMPHGSLDQHLSGNSDETKVLCWKNRLRIALEVAEGLEYLHSCCNPPIVHRDIKAANILLDQNFRAKLADFGLSRFFADQEATHVSTEIAGTRGYLDPEYCRTSMLTVKSDVYSFGVVVLELVTGKPPICVADSGDCRIHISEWVSSRLVDRGDVDRVADQTMRGLYDAESLWDAVEVARQCIEPSSPSDRPTMTEVVARFKGLLESA